MALMVCAIKGLLTTIVFIAMPHSPNLQHAHSAAYARADRMVEAQMARVSVTHAIVQTAKSAFAADTRETSLPQDIQPFAVLPPDEPVITWELAWVAGTQDPNEKAPALFSVIPPPRAPPGLRYAAFPASQHFPSSRIGLFIAWATPPPLHA